jgi:2-polyprenyl-6-methoxyphenol hydroxylase-like FAD-dependent oxidoreductase
MAVEKPSIAIIGAGIGGLTAAACLTRFGFKVVGLIEPLRSKGFVLAAFHSREWDTAKVTNVLIMGKSLEQRYGAPDLMIHRARLHSALAALTPPHYIHFGKRLIAIEHGASGATLVFADGIRDDAAVVIVRTAFIQWWERHYLV